MQENDLIELLKQHDQKGMDELLTHYVPLIRYIIAPIIKNANEREECLSEVSMRIWDKIALYDSDKGTFKGWISSLARNTALNYVCKKDTHESCELTRDIASPKVGTVDYIIQKERKEMLRSVLAELSSRDKALIYRKYFYMQPISQIASELGTTERAVEGRLYRLKKQLRCKMGGQYNE
jgi:RNA polymerase sigma-70 factor (ECF subfamily)